MNMYRDYHFDIDDLIYRLKQTKSYTDDQVAAVIGKSGATIAGHRSRKTFPLLKFRDVALIANAAGYRIRFEKV